MQADVTYNDYKGTAAADISDHLGNIRGDDLKRIAEYFQLDEDRFTIVGLSIYGTEDFLISLLCVDKEKSTPDKEHIVHMSCETENNILEILFKRLQIVLHNRYDEKYPNLHYDEEVNYSDFHPQEED